MSEITANALNDLRGRILEHQKLVREGKADPSSPPYTREELKDALAAISLNREAIASQAPTPRARKSTAKTVDLDSLLDG